MESAQPPEGTDRTNERDDRRWVCDECRQMVALGPGEGWHYVNGERCPGEPAEYIEVATYEGAVAALDGIVQAAIKYGVNDQVAEAIAHAEVVMGTRRSGGQS